MQRLDCRSEELNTCIQLADPLLQANHVFPTNDKDINHVCNVLFPETWSKFVACIKQYTTSCLTQDQRSDFNRAVGDSINSVHKMCTNEDYKNDYLRHAECIKQKSMAPEHCGPYYSTLIDMVKGTVPTDQRQICCAHSSFKDCVIAETKACPCTGDDCLQGMEATGFARAMLDKALGFLLKQCHSYKPNQDDCKIYQITPEKQPRVEEPSKMPSLNGNDDSRYDSGAYFPSGLPSRSEVEQEKIVEEDNWTSINKNLEESGGAPPREDRTTQVPSLFEPVPVEETTTGPVLLSDPQPIYPPQDDEHMPWIPSDEIHSFDDIFNTVDNTRAQELASTAIMNSSCLIVFVCIFVLMWE